MLNHEETLHVYIHGGSDVNYTVPIKILKMHRILRNKTGKNDDIIFIVIVIDFVVGKTINKAVVFINVHMRL